jgi:hypothetical protein
MSSQNKSGLNGKLICEMPEREKRLPDEDHKFYMDRINYYKEMLRDPRPPFRGFGEIEFYHKDLESVKWTLEYWEDGFEKAKKKANKTSTE